MLLYPLVWPWRHLQVEKLLQVLGGCNFGKLVSHFQTSMMQRQDGLTEQEGKAEMLSQQISALDLTFVICKVSKNTASGGM